MNLLIIITLLLFIFTWIVQGINFATIMSFIATMLFCGRKVGYFCKRGNVIALEIAGMFLTFVFQILLKRFHILECFIVILLRCSFLAMMEYDMRMYVYVSEERRRDTLE